MTAADVIKLLRQDGWYEVSQEGGHKKFKHDVKPGHTIVPMHKGDLKIGTLKNIYRQAGWGKP